MHLRQLESGSSPGGIASGGRPPFGSRVFSSPAFSFTAALVLAASVAVAVVLRFSCHQAGKLNSAPAALKLGSVWLIWAVAAGLRGVAVTAAQSEAAMSLSEIKSLTWRASKLPCSLRSL